jgi:predicted O-methyltransferase YrrM
MAYHGYISLVKQYLHQQVPREVPPAVLEVGVDRGVTFLPMVVFLARTRPAFTAIGVDILVQEQVRLTLQNIDRNPSQSAYLIEDNSLTVLPKMVDQGMQFDVLFLDGDHNYHTVSQEMQLVGKLVKPGGIVVCDDYDGRWSDRDLWYSEREGYEDNKHASAKVDTEKHGVKPAIDEWLEAHPDWQKAKPIGGEPVLLMRKAV